MAELIETINARFRRNVTEDGGRRKKAFMAYLRPKSMHVKKDAYRKTAIVGQHSPVDVLVKADDSTKTAETIISISWPLLAKAKTNQEAGAWFVSVVGALIPEVITVLIEPLKESGAKVSVIAVPSIEARTAGYKLNETTARRYFESVVFLGICLLLPFKHVTEKNYASFVKARLRAIGGRLGMSESVVANMKFPLSFHVSRKIREVFSVSLGVKKAILKYIMWASETENALQGMARYVASILAWNEMHLLAFIANVFVNSGSPVLKDLRIQHEVCNYAHVLRLIVVSKTPQYFRYFCSAAEEQMPQQHNFPVLYVVARELINMKSMTRSLINIAGTTKRSELVIDLVKMHVNYCKSNKISEKFLLGDAHYDEIMQQDENQLN